MSASGSRAFRASVLAVGCAAVVAAAVPSAAATPPSDDRGYIDSTARCTAPDTAVAFGVTATSRVAVCKSPDGSYEYRGVRVRDGAKLIIPVTSSGGGTFTADNGGIDYMVTASSLVVSAGTKVIREEPWVEFHGLGTSGTSTAPTTTATPAPPVDPLPAEVGGSAS